MKPEVRSQKPEAARFLTSGFWLPAPDFLLLQFDLRENNPMKAHLKLLALVVGTGAGIAVSAAAVPPPLAAPTAPMPAPAATPAAPGGAIGGQVATKQQLDFFEGKIRPLLAENCYKCH